METDQLQVNDGRRVLIEHSDLVLCSRASW